MRTSPVRWSLIFSGVLLILSSPSAAVDSQPFQINTEILNTIYSGHESMHYSVSWSGGIKIGDLYLTVVPAVDDDGYIITARVTDYGLFRLFYPVDDTFITSVRGGLKLPYQYEVLQKEGHGGHETRRFTSYDQSALQVRYQKNEQPVQEFSLSGTAYNEFSSFYITRALELDTQRSVIVPAFVDEKRHEVAVTVLAREDKESLFGEVPTLKVMPKMEFKGLYDKDGDTVFWLTDDVCRVPIGIESKILIGSLTAELVEYSNPACQKWSGQQVTSEQVP